MAVNKFERLFLQLQRIMTAVCFVLVLYEAGVVWSASIHIVQNGLASSFLQEASHVPRRPAAVYMACFVLMTAASYLVLNPRPASNRRILTDGLLKAALVCGVLSLLNMSCGCLLLWIFSDIVHSMRQFGTRQVVMVGALIIFLYMVFSYPVLSPLFPMIDLTLYFGVFGRTAEAMLVLGKTLLEGIVVLLFILLMCLFIADQYQEKENIAQELSMVSRVNRNLQEYAKVTERIGENKERKRLAREIHDTLGHALTGIAAGIDATLAIMDKNPKAARQQLELVRQVVAEGIGDVRASLNKLRPGALERQGLQGALEKMVQEFRAVSGMEIELVFEADGLDFEKVKEDVCFRLVQESLTNAQRHGHASRVVIVFEWAQAGLHIRIQDNGVGAETITYGYGLTQMEENVSSIHGTVSYDGSAGFLTDVYIPVRKGERDDSDRSGR